MKKGIRGWAARFALVCAISVAMMGPVLVVHAAPEQPPRAVVASVAKAAAVTASIAPAASSVLEPMSGSTKVYIADHPTKYHRSNCRYVRRSKHAVTLKYAKSLGLGPCKVCKPPKK